MGQRIKNVGVVAAVLSFAVLGAPGCSKKKEGDKGPEKSEKTTEAKPAAAAGCSEKAFKHTNPNFCLEVPEGFEAQPETKSATGTMELSFLRKSDDYSFGVAWAIPGNPDDVLNNVKSPGEGEKVVEGIDLPGGGYFKHAVIREEGDTEDYHVVSAAAKGAKDLVTCAAESKKKDFIDAVIMACKSLRVE